VGELIRHAPTAVIFLLGLATCGGAFAHQSFNVKAEGEFQRAADSRAFLHRQAERQIGMEHRRAGVPIDQIASNELAARIVNLRANEAKQMLFTPAVAATLREIAARAARAPTCDPGELRSGVWVTSYRANSRATGTKTVSECIASALPSLPDELEYRSAGTVLVLVDTHANLVVDVLPALLIGGGR
jgi:hypothetical protein